MGKNSHTFSDSEIHILDTGLRWIREAPEAFADKLYHRLLLDYPTLGTALHSISLQSFSRNFLRFLEAVIEEVRTHKSIQLSLNEYFSDHLLIQGIYLKPAQITAIFEAYLDVFSEIAEDAWSPALESVWQKAVDEVSLNLSGLSSEAKSISVIPSLVRVIRRRENRPGRAVLLLLGTLAIVAGSIISMILRPPCRLPERKLLKSPSFKKAWSS